VNTGKPMASKNNRQVVFLACFHKMKELTISLQVSASQVSTKFCIINLENEADVKVAQIHPLMRQIVTNLKSVRDMY
jgi:hypothetical protein